MGLLLHHSRTQVDAEGCAASVKRH